MYVDELYDCIIDLAYNINHNIPVTFQSPGMSKYIKDSQDCDHFVQILHRGSAWGRRK